MKCSYQNAVYESHVLRAFLSRSAFNALYLFTPLINLRSIDFSLKHFG